MAKRRIDQQLETEVAARLDVIDSIINNLKYQQELLDSEDLRIPSAYLNEAIERVIVEQQRLQRELKA